MDNPTAGPSIAAGLALASSRLNPKRSAGSPVARSLVVSIDSGQHGAGDSVKIGRDPETGRLAITVQAFELLSPDGLPMSKGDVAGLSPEVLVKLDAALAAAQIAVAYAVRATQEPAAQ